MEQECRTGKSNMLLIDAGVLMKTGGGGADGMGGSSDENKPGEPDKKPRPEWTDD